MSVASSASAPNLATHRSSGSSGARSGARHEPGYASQGGSEAGSESESHAFGSQFHSQNAGDAAGAQGGGLQRASSTPGPGEYVWQDSVNLRKKPSWSMSVPDRKNLDLLLGSWTPATSSQQPRAPAPVYEITPTICGKYGPPKWTYARASGRPCLARDPPKKAELTINLPSSLGGVNPMLKRVPQWSVFGKDRSSLPPDVPTWTPKMDSDVRPGPGQHDVFRTPNWKPRNRRGCTWGGRTAMPSKYPNLGGGR